MQEQKNHGFISNYLYTMKMAKKSNVTIFVVIIMIGIVSFSLELLEVYTPKIILSLVEEKSTVNKFIMYVVAIGIAIIVFNIIFNFAWQWFDALYKITAGFLEKQRMHKVYNTDFKNMESPEFLDYVQRAKNALYYNQGFHGILYQSRNLLANTAIAIVTAVLIGRKNILVMLIICMLSVVISKILSWVTKRDKEKFSDFMAPTYRKITYLANTTKNFDFAKDIRLFHMARIFGNEFGKVNRFFMKHNMKHHNRWILCNFSMEAVVLLQKIMMYIWLVYTVIYKGMLISDFVLYIGLVTSLTNAISYLLWIYSNLKGNSLMVNDYRKLMDWEEDKDTEKVCKNIDEINLDSFEFEFVNVSFKYPGHDNYILKNVNIKIKAGMKLAIVGVNGAGKTTFVKLMLRLYEPSKGKILLNGTDIREFDRKQYFKIFAPVFQNIECFALPLYQNISFKNEEDTDMELIDKVLKRSDLTKKINMYEQGVYTNLLRIFDKKGIDLSGGEKQKLAMARALYKDGGVIILDEPTAAFDALAEDRMYRKFKEMTENKTCLFISHRLGSTQFCDNIVMFDAGSIIEEGSHEELMKLNGKYAYMFNIQSQYYIKEA